MCGIAAIFNYSNAPLRVDEDVATKDDLIIEKTLKAVNLHKRNEIKKRTKDKKNITVRGGRLCWRVQTNNIKEIKFS